MLSPVTPAKAGAHLLTHPPMRRCDLARAWEMGPRFRGGDGWILERGDIA